MSKKNRRRREQQKRNQQVIRVPCAEIKVVERDGRRHLTGLELPTIPGQWLWQRTTSGPLWEPLSTTEPGDEDEDLLEVTSETTDTTANPDVIDDDDGEIDELDFGLVADSLRILVRQTIERKDPEPGRRFDDAFEAVASGEADEDALGFSLVMTFGQLLAWFAGAREIVGAKGAADALDWVRDHLGPEAHQKCTPLSGILEHPMADVEHTVSDLIDDLRGDLVAPSIWLISGVVAVAAEHDVLWLQQFDLSKGREGD